MISMLLKVETQLDEVSPESYLRQADEVFSRGPAKTEGLSHPEAFIRARAVKLWADRDPEAEQDPGDARRPAGAGQPRPAGPAESRRADSPAAGRLLSRRWMQTDRFWPMPGCSSRTMLRPRTAGKTRRWPRICGRTTAHAGLLRYVLLDFVTADRDLEELPLAAALVLAEKLGLKDRFAEIAKRELRLRKKQLETIDQDKEKLLAKANEDSVSP